jgi:thioredoxin-related protein
MRRRVFVALTLMISVVALGAADAVQATGPPWIRDFNDGQLKAREAKKDLLVVFTGHGWCESCGILDHEVFQNPDFVREAAKSFVFVELDFTFGDSDKERQRQRVDRELQQRYLAPAVPEVFLLDQEGVPYAILEGYTKGTGPVKTLALLEQARAAHATRDQKFAAAAKSAGRDRAALLDAGLQAVAPLLGTLDVRGDDPILAFYPTAVAEIRRLDSGREHALAALYDARQKKRDEWLLVRDSTIGKLQEFDKKRDYKGAVAFVDAALKEIKAPDVRWQLETARQTHLEWDDQFAAALANVRRLLAEPNRTPEDREYLLGRESFNLFRLGRVDEAVAIYDRRIRDAQASPQKRLHLLNFKADLLKYTKAPPAVKIKAYREYRDAAPPKSDDWVRATWQLALLLQKSGDHRQALRLQSEYIEADPKASWIMLDAAASHLALGENDAARALIRDAEKALPEKPERESDKDYAKRVRTRIAGLQDRLAKQTK